MNSLEQDINDQNVPVSNLLRRAKVVATKLGQKDSLAWINKELDGYPDDDKHWPSYREISGQVKFWNPFRGWCPVIFSKQENEDVFSKRPAKQSVAETEELLKSGNNEYEMPFPGNIAAMIIGNQFQKTKVSLMINRVSLVGILNSVRSALQDWVLDLKKKGIKIEEEAFSQSDKEKAEDVGFKVRVDKIENFSGVMGSGNYIPPGIPEPPESLTSKIVWSVIVALIVLIIGNVIAGLILKYWFGIPG